MNVWWDRRVCYKVFFQFDNSPMVIVTDCSTVDEAIFRLDDLVEQDQPSILAGAAVNPSGEIIVSWDRVNHWHQTVHNHDCGINGGFPHRAIDCEREK